MTKVAKQKHDEKLSSIVAFDERQVAVVLAAHGERAGDYSNSALLCHANTVRDRCQFACVTAGVLNGKPVITDALEHAKNSGAVRIYVYPFFMSDGYFVGKVLPQRIAEVGVSELTKVLRPLGADPNLPELMFQHALQAAAVSGFEPKSSRLLVVGHGSKGARASKRATETIADELRRKREFAEVEIALLEEPPLLDEALANTARPTVVAGFFAAPGLHAAIDVPEAIKRTNANAVFTGAIGATADIANLIERAVADAITQVAAS